MLDFDLEALVRFEAGVLKPTAGDLEPREERRIGAVAAVGLPLAIAPGLLNGDMPLGMSGRALRLASAMIDSGTS